MYEIRLWTKSGRKTISQQTLKNMKSKYRVNGAPTLIFHVPFSFFSTYTLVLDVKNKDFRQTCYFFFVLFYL